MEQEQHKVEQEQQKMEQEQGSGKRQTSLLPKAMLRASPPPTAAQDLKLDLRTFYGNGRSLFLDFGHTYLKIAFLVHSSVQFYSKKIWRTSIMGVKSQTICDLTNILKDRGFKIGLAIEFEDFFLQSLPTILSSRITLPTWVTDVDQSLPPQERFNLGPDVLGDYRHFLRCVAEWIEYRRVGKGVARNGPACKAMRSASHIWVGVGVYTVAEIFFIAGLSPFLAECEVFDSPSRTARLCEAFWQFAYNARLIFEEYVRRSIEDNIIAPTTDHRLRYQNLLRLISEFKDKVQMLGRRKRSWTRNESDFHDPFEPQYMLEALLQTKCSGEPLDRDKPISLGPLIFGAEEWAKAVENYDWVERRDDDDSNLEDGDVANDPLSMMFFDAAKGERITRDLDDSSSVSKQVTSDINQQHSRMFHHIVTRTNKVSIGPLEYCGHGKRIITLQHLPIEWL
ncbi:hypothetical protein BKA70DRAFT_1230480 [Coprinopsis sp. MPI-PUGE-AT-0042]|nr:hypothetical protein BKA70DRAFT_1230480 [Coprinopsis sp. MPI-PUGE-AT-0042]